MAEAYDAYRKKRNDLGEELADVVIYLLRISEILGIDLEKEILHKINKNIHREYKVINGVNTRVKEYEEKKNVTLGSIFYFSSLISLSI